MQQERFTRRTLVRAVPALAAVSIMRAAETGDCRLTARPRPDAPATVTPGLRPLGLRHERDALLYIPESSAQFEKAPLVVSLHGATRDADRGISLFRALADEIGFVLLAPASTAQTWDGIQGFFGEDIRFINAAMAAVYGIRRIDPARVAMAGFSDGASYSLSIGVANGDLFNSVFGFSAGFIIPADRIGKPPIFMSHGTIDTVLPIELCGRPVSRQLKADGYRVIFREFEGKHTLPPEIASEAMHWFMNPS